MSERELLAWIRRRLGPAPRDVLIDSGDDAAAVRAREGTLLLKVDQVVEGVHWARGELSPREVGRKAMARALSDVAAMGGRPLHALVTFCLPRAMTMAQARALFDGLHGMARRFGARVVGGDVAAHRGPLVVGVALTGVPVGSRPIPRGGARPGDKLLASGSLGGSRLGKHARFTPRLALAAKLARGFDVHAMIDVSDGLARDVANLAVESGAGAVLYAWQVPISPAARRMARRTGRAPLWHALHDGEDYELVLAAGPAEALRLTKELPLRVIGEVVARRGLWLRDERGRARPLAAGGWSARWRP